MFICDKCKREFTNDLLWEGEYGEKLCLACFLDVTVECPKCKGDLEYEEWLPPVEVGVQQPGEPIPCSLCNGNGYIFKDEAKRWERDNAPPADTIRRKERLFK